MSTDSDEPRGSSGPRANAVPSTEFTRLSTVDARVSDALLDVLEDAGIAARVEPSAGDVGPYRDVRPHPLPEDVLYVDAARREEAGALVGAELPGMLAELRPATRDWTDEDETFASIIAGFNTDEPDTVERSSSLDPVPRLRRRSDDDWETRVAANNAAFDEQDHFVPPPPPPLPRLTGPRLWGIAMLAAALLLLVVVPLAGGRSEGQLVTGILLAVAGTGVIIWQMREGRSDDDPDDGAVI